MAAPFHDIEEKAETLFKEYFDAGATLTGLNLYVGFDNSAIATPSIEIFCAEAEPEVIGETPTGNWFLTMEFMLRTSVDDTSRTAHGEYMAEIRDILIAGVGEVVTDLNAVVANPTDFTAHQWTPGPSTREVDEEKNQRLTTQTGILFCEPSD